MDPNELYEHGRARFEHAAARRLLREKYQAKLIFAHAGGMWQAGPQLISVLQACRCEEAVIEDLYATPVEIKVADLLALTHARWQEQMTAWLIEHRAINNQR